MKRFTVGVTTHNEERTISTLLDQLSNFDTSEIDIIIFDDCSTDNTRGIIESHSVSRQENFRAYFSDVNHKTPSVGRTYVGANAKTEYSILIDGDDFIDVDQLKRIIKEAPSNYDIIITPYQIRGKYARMKCDGGDVEISNNSIMNIISAIAGKAYKSELLKEFGPESIRGRSDDARLNIRILLSMRPRIFYIPDITFYLQVASRKSIRIKTINFDEVHARVASYAKLQDKYPIDKRYLAALKTNLLKIIKEDNDSTPMERNEASEIIKNAIRFEPKRIVFIGNNTSLPGGIPQRLRNVISRSVDRDVEYIGIMSEDTGGIQNCYSAKDNEKNIIKMISEWHRCDTVLIVANNLIRGFSEEIQKKFHRFPIIYMGSAQLSFFVQDSVQMADLEYINQFRCSAIISFSDMDINFQKQLGIFGQVKGFNPVNTRETNSFDIRKPKQLGYVGRIDFASKGCERLIDVARAVKANGMQPIKIFTTRAKNSPDYDRFIEMIEAEQLADQFDITLECTDKDYIYKDITLLLLPSKKESFGNVILEAFSHGIPVIGTSYAPGPSELIEHGKTGCLLDDFTGDGVMDFVLAASGERLAEMSEAAFEKHKNYSLEAHLGLLEKVATDVLNEFGIRNELPVFPELKIARTLAQTKKKLALLRDSSRAGAKKAVEIEDRQQAKLPQRKFPRGEVDISPELGRMSKRAQAESRHHLAELAREIAELEERRGAWRRV